MKNFLKSFYLTDFVLVALVLIFYPAGSSLSQNVQPKDIVSVETVITNDSSKINGLIYADVNLNIKDSWHINANKPLDDYLTPTSVSIKGNKDVQIIKIKYPAPLIMKLGFSDADLALYEDQATVKVILKVLNSKKLKSIKIKGEVQYQPCNNQTCLFPVTKEFFLDTVKK